MTPALSHITAPADRGRLLGLAIVALYAALWAAIEVLAFSADVGIEQLVWTRYGLHLLVMAAALGPRRGIALVRTARPGLHVIRSLTMLVMPGSYLLASAYLPGRDILAVFWTAPLMLLAFTRGRQPRWRWLCALAAFAATVVMLRPGPAAASGYMVLSLAMAASFALYIRLTDDLSADPIATNLFHSALWVFFALTPRMPAVWQWPDAAAWAILAAVALLGLLSLYLIDIAVRRGGPAIFVPMLYLQPLILLVITSGGRGIGRRMLAGLTVITVALAIAAVRDGRSERRLQAAA